MDTDQEVTRTRHQMKVPGIGVLIAPNAVGRTLYPARLHEMPTVHEKTDATRAISNSPANDGSLPQPCEKEVWNGKSNLTPSF